MELLQLCEITGKKAVSCIIDGLNDPATQNSARAGRYSTPESLYEEYLSTLNERRRERFVNGTIVEGYIDTGNEAILLRQDLAEQLALEVLPCTVLLKGYAGGSVRAIGSATVTIDIQNVEITAEVLVVPNEVQKVPILVGQPYVNHPNVVMIVHNEELRFHSKSDADLLKLDILCNDRKIPILAREATEIPPKFVGYVNVTTNDDYTGTAYVEATTRCFNSDRYHIGRCVLEPQNGVLLIANTADVPLIFKVGQIIVRGEQCVAEQQTGDANEVSVNNVKVSDYKPFREIDLNIDAQVPCSIKTQLLHLVNKYRKTFSESLQELGTTHLTEMKLLLTDDRPVTYRPYSKDTFDDGVLTKEERLPKNEGTTKACQSKGSQRIVHLAQLRERALERIKFQQRLTKQRYDRKRAKPKSYSVGDHVLVRRERSSNDGASRKLLPKYDGPFVITKVLDHDRLIVMDLQGNLRGGRGVYVGVYPSEKLKPFKAGTSSTDEDECLNSYAAIPLYETYFLTFMYFNCLRNKSRAIWFSRDEKMDRLAELLAPLCMFQEIHPVWYTKAREAYVPQNMLILHNLKNV
ncbi:hypothetical protein NQ315_002320 [Exocentrus adspersus]|uniref:Peptidase A2 domain-containing protein n=1 Tax=Exocentrus adspersus TaxID=1586481 RepID=A0AAV8VTJ5_9CUCU|nr:hypothetical protein NQ315_002320 [Exocentrus adspersus]